jgi:NAD(P)-dependent dehydrogenase (short-subunit alcohol dehydrogenase family)
VFYDLAMHAVSRLAQSFAHDLGPHGVTALAVSPGFTRTEAILAALGDDLPPGTDSVEFPGRAVRALWADPEFSRRHEPLRVL